MLALCLTPVVEGAGGFASATAEDYNSFLRRHLDAVEELHRRHDIPAIDTAALMKEVGAYYRRRLNWFPKMDG